MAQSTRPPANGFVRVMRRVYNPLGFSKGYNAVLWFLATGYIFAFTLARLEYLSFGTIFCGVNRTPGSGAAPGECYYWLQDPFKIGLKLHLFTILPAAFLVCFQFVPVIRYTFTLFHRINGHVVIALSFISSAGALMVTQHVFGGDLSTQAYIGMLVILTTIGYIMAYVNIKFLQIDQHRAWMLRTWSWFATIITIRLIQLLSALIISKRRGFWTTWPCAQIDSVLGPSDTVSAYPGCNAYYDGTNPDKRSLLLLTLVVMRSKLVRHWRSRLGPQAGLHSYCIPVLSSYTSHLKGSW
ncbi:hypothetical protein LTR86_010406 [Recurvomyces mirabilis]|nr:hypothetical protein LTR86_010406 [Recurvomyces mirabilis]